MAALRPNLQLELIARKKLSLRPMYEEVGTGKYGDQSCRVGGVICASIEQPGKESTLITRLHTWTVQRSGLAVINAAEAQASHDRSLRKGPNADFYLAYDAMEASKFERSGEAASTWTRVNNCTRDALASIGQTYTDRKRNSFAFYLDHKFEGSDHGSDALSRT